MDGKGEDPNIIQWGIHALSGGSENTHIGKIHNGSEPPSFAEVVGRVEIVALELLYQKKERASRATLQSTGEK